jgi:hypothetical protein
MRRDDRWAWRYDEPAEDACGAELVLLSKRDLRVLGLPALALWMELERERGWGPRWITGRENDGTRLKDYAARLGFSPRKAKRALARLRASGLAKTRRQQRDPLTGYSPGIEYRVFGTWERRDGALRVLAPACVHGWANDHAGWGGPRLGAGRPGKSSCPLTPRQEPLRPADDQGVRNQVVPSVLDHHKYKAFHLPSGERKAERVGGPPARPFLSLEEGSGRTAGAMFMVREPAPPAPTTLEDAIARLDKIAAGGRCVVKPLCERGDLVLPPLDPLPKELNGHPPLTPGLQPSYYVGHLARAYRSAVQAAFGKPSYVLSRGTLEKSRFFDMLRESADFLVEHEIPPDAWAMWVVSRSKARGQDRPPPINLVFALGLLRKQHGWFWREYQDAGFHVKIAKVNMEQLFRRQEATRTWRGLSPRASRRAMPGWYVQMREEEERMGYADPLSLYPRAPCVQEAL